MLLRVLLLFFIISEASALPGLSFEKKAVRQDLKVRSWFGFVFWDFNNDGLTDLFINNHSAIPPQIILNSEQGFQEEADQRELAQRAIPAFGDFHATGVFHLNNDNNIDYVQLFGGNSGQYKSQANVFRFGNEQGIFAKDAKIHGDSNSGRSYDLKIFDANYDGLLDIFVLNQHSPYHGDSQRELLIQSENGVFKNQFDSFFDYGALVSWGWINQIEWQDIDGDGSLDAIVGGNVYGFKQRKRIDFSKHIKNEAGELFLVDVGSDGFWDLCYQKVKEAPRHFGGSQFFNSQYWFRNRNMKGNLRVRFYEKPVIVNYAINARETPGYWGIRLGKTQLSPENFWYSERALKGYKVIKGVPDIVEPGIYLYELLNGSWELVVHRTEEVPQSMGIGLRYVTEPKIIEKPVDTTSAPEYGLDIFCNTLGKVSVPFRMKINSEHFRFGSILDSHVADYDNNGFQDVAIVDLIPGGKNTRLSILYQNEKGVFSLEEYPLLSRERHNIQAFDLDNNGLLDLAISSRFKFSNFDIWMNKRKPKSNWISFRLLGSGKNARSPFGTPVELHTTKGILKAHYGQNQKGNVYVQSLHFGLGDAQIKKLIVHWSSGSQTIDGNTLTRGEENTIEN